MLSFKNKLWLVLATIALLVYCAIEAQGEGDFFIFSYAAGDLYQGANIYHKTYHGQYHYYYSVLFAVFIRLFYFLPYYGVKFCWLLLNVSLFFHLFYLLSQASQVKALDEKRRRWFLFSVFLFSFRFFHDNIHTSQITILMLWCCIYGLRLVSMNRPAAGALVLAIGINIKLLPLVTLPYLFYRGHWKAFIFSLLFCTGFIFLPSLFIGHAYNMELLSSWWALVNPSGVRHVLDVDERSFHSLTTLLSVLLVEKVPDQYAMALKRNVADVSLESLTHIILFTRLCLIAFTVYFLRFKTLFKNVSFFDRCLEISYLLLLVPLIFPHQQHYAFLFIVPAFGCSVYYLLKNGDALNPLAKRAIALLLTTAYLCSNLKLLLGEFNRYYEHYKILTYGALLLIPALSWVAALSRKKHQQ